MPFANDFFSSNRFKNLFGGEQPPQQGFMDLLQPNPASPIDFGAFAPPPIPQEAPAQVPQYDAGARMRELYNPSTDATARFENLLSQYPEREKPGVLRTIAAMLRDYTHGPAEGRAVYDEPFNEKLMDWGNQIAPAQQAANLERQENVNARTLAYNTLQGEQSQRRQDETERKNKVDQDIKQQRANVYEWKSQNPNLEFDFRGPYVIVADPVTGKLTTTTTKTGLFSEADKMALQHKNVMGEIGARGDEARETVRATGEEARKTKEVVPGSATANKPESPTQKKVGEYLRARQLKNSGSPLSKFIQLDTIGANTFEVTPSNPSAWTERGRGPTAEQLKEINDIISGVGTKTETGTETKTEAKKSGVNLNKLPTPGVAPPAPVGWKYVAKPGGGWTAIPDR
jgi:hypothetical protein